MKSIFTKLSTLLYVGALALVGCTDFSADLREVNDKLDNLANSAATKTEVADLKAQIEALQAEIESQYATKEEVAAISATIEAIQAGIEAAKAELVAALENKADKTAVDAAIAELVAALQNAQTEINAALEALASEDVAIKDSIAELLASIQTLQADVKTLQTALAAVEGNVAALETEFAAELAKVTAGIETLTTELTDLSTAFADYKEQVEAEFAKIGKQFEETVAAVNARFEEIEETIANLPNADLATKDEVAAEVEALEALLAEVNALLAEKVDILLANDNALAAKDEALAAKDKELAAAIAELEKAYADLAKANEGVSAEVAKQIEAVAAEIDDVIATVASNYEALAGRLAACEKAIEDLTGRVEDLENTTSALRSVVLVPDMLYNGTKAVKFHRQDGKNVLKTFATVSYRFNPSNFDASTATYEIVAEQVEIMTKGILTEGPAIEIVGTPVQADDMVTFELERGEGAGNMFALKVTLEDGTTIYSEYAAIVDEATFAFATATASFPVQRLAFSYPDLSSISAIIEYVKSLGDTIEDFATTIEAINGAIQAIQANDVVSALEHLVKIPGLEMQTATITGTGSYRVQVETLDAAEIIESLQNAQSIDEIRNIITDLLAQAEGLGETGSAIIDGLNGAFGNSGLNDLFGQYDNLKDFKLPELVLTYEKAVATLDGYQAELDKARAEFQSLKDQMDAIVSGLDAETKATIAALEAELEALNAQYDELEARYNAASGLDKLSIGAEMATVWAKIEAKELEISSKAGTDYFKVKAELDLKEAGVKTAELLLEGARKAVDVADKAVKDAEENIAKLESEILSKIKNYIFENTELGKYLTELENALGEQAWEAKMSVAAGTAQLFAIDALIADLIQNYNAANQKVVDDFANSLFGRVAFLIQTKEAADAFELIGLTELYTVLKQLPDLLTLIIKYYPAGVDLTNFTNFNDFGTVFSDYLTNLIPETTVEWETDYFLAE